VIGHYYGCMKVVSFAVVVEAVLEDGILGIRSEGYAIAFAECYEQRSSRSLIVREHTAVFVFSIESLLGQLWDYQREAKARNHKIKSNVKGVGQECPTHTSIAFSCWLVCD
jgi:hypothetical protein